MSSKTLQAARAAVAHLFENPPVNMPEMKERLSGLAKDDLRRALIEQLEQDGVPEPMHALFDAAMSVVKPGKLRGRLSALALDTSRSDVQRAIALGTLLRNDAAEARRVIERLEPGGHDRLMAVPMRGIAAVLLESDAPGEGLRDTCAATPVVAPVIVFEMEKLRRHHGASASDIYGPALEAGLLLEQRLSLVEAIGAEGDAAAIALLERLRDSAGGDEAFRSACQEALLRASSARIAPSRKPAGIATGRTWVTTCDGQGAFTILSEFPGRLGTLPILANLCIRASSDIRDGFSNELPAHLIPEFVQRFEQFAQVVPVPPGVAAALALEGVARTEDLGKPIPKDARRPVKLLSQVEHEPLPPWPVSPAPMPSREQVNVLFLDPKHRAQSWFFDDGDFSAGGELPSLPHDVNKESLEKWLLEATACMDTPEIRSRLVEIARHEARCLAWSGDEAEAAVFVALGMDAEENGLRESPWAHAMILQGMEHADIGEESMSPADLVGDGMFRRSLRGQFFMDVTAPTGRDLARLDFTELSYLALEEAAKELPGHRRPSDVELREAARELGFAAADEVITDPEGYALDHLVADVVSSRLGMTSPDELEAGTTAVLDAIDEFVEALCGSCPQACLERPDAPMRKVFVSDIHPAI